MFRYHAIALLSIALLDNLASAFSRTTASQMPTLPGPSYSAFIPLPNSQSKDVFQQQNGVLKDVFSSQKALSSRTPLSMSSGASEINDIRGGSESNGAGRDLNITTGKVLASLWGTSGVAYILIKAIKRVLPIALEPFSKGEGVVPLTQFQLAAYITTCLWFAYVEGYKGFQLKFSPLVVSRSFTLQPSSPIQHLLLAPFYSMGLFHATKKRMIVSWSVSIGVAAIVAAVKRLPYPWRNVVDAGVVVGLTWGCLSMLGGYLISLVTGIAPMDMDPALPGGEE